MRTLALEGQDAAETPRKTGLLALFPRAALISGPQRRDKTSPGVTG